jgi:two-component system, chemotaxis family, chemotaxis protein CheY
MRLLIADDDLICRNILHAIVLPYGKCDTVATGAEAVTAFENALQEKRPYDMVFLDIEMPEMDGHETLRRIRTIEKEMAVPSRRRVRIVMVTGSRDLENVRAARQAECDSYVVKPVERERVLDEVRRLSTPAQVPSAALGPELD